MADRSGYNSGLTRRLWLAWPSTFGRDIRKDMEIIGNAGRFAAPGQAVGVGRAFADVMESVGDFFEGDGFVLYQTQENRKFGGKPQRNLDHLDSGLLTAFGDSIYMDSDDFEATKKLFFEGCPEAADLLQRYETCGKEYLHCEEADKGSRLKDQALRAGVHLVLLAHEFQARREGRRNETVFARKLVEIIAITEGSRAGELTREHVYQGLKIAANEGECLSANTMAAAIENELSLQKMAGSLNPGS